MNRAASTPMRQPITLHRQSLDNFIANSRSPSAGFAGYGMSSGVKISNPVVTGLDRRGTNPRGEFALCE